MKPGGSYEGYVQLLCENGHQWSVDCYQYCTEAVEICNKCGKPAIWTNQVDLTNGSIDEDTGECISGYVELEVDKEVICTKCGSTTDITYKIPSKQHDYIVEQEDDGEID